jgi:peptide/nickel transport system permease protein
MFPYPEHGCSLSSASRGGVGLKGYYRYFGKKFFWFFITFVAAFLLNFILPRLMPGDPVAAITSRVVRGIDSPSAIQQIYNQYAELFGTDKPMLEQFFLYVRNVARGDFGVSFSEYPRPVANIISTSIWWTVACSYRRSSSAG